MYLHRDCEMGLQSQRKNSHGGRLHGGPHKTMELSKLVGGHLHENGCIPGTLHYTDNTLHKIILFAVVNWYRYTFCL